MTSVGAAPGRVGAILCNWNGMHYVGRCLEALRSQTRQVASIVVVDNGSSDGSPEWIREHHPKVCLIPNATNVGFAAGYNQGLAAVDCQFALILNADVFLAEDFVERGVAELEVWSDVAAITGRFYEEATDREVNGGFFLRPQIRIQPCPLTPGSREVFGTTAAAALFRSDALKQVSLDGEVFDENFFAYGEDIDLSWRLQLAGWKIRSDPEIFAHHLGSGSLGGRLRFLDKPVFFQRHTLKNRYLTFIKNATASVAWRLLPGLLMFEMLLWPFLLLRQPLRVPYLLTSWLEVARLLPSTLRKRRAIQCCRRGSMAHLLRYVRGL